MPNKNNSSEDSQIIITSRQEFFDIDILACAISLKNLLDLQEINSEVVLPGYENESITATVKNWNYKLAKQLPKKSSKNKYIIVDNSDPAVFASFVNIDKVIELFDHRTGFENFWKNKLKNKAHIDKVGSCATLIWEEYIKNNLDNNINKLSANLLITAIVSNTLNFNANITTNRDRDAYSKLIKYSDLSDNWVGVYFNEISFSAMSNPIKAIKNDTKEFTIGEYKYRVGQLELWDNENFIKNYKDDLLSTISANQSIMEFITLPSISKGFNYILTKNEDFKKIISKAIEVDFKGYVGKTSKLWLRKELIERLQKIHASY